MQMQVAKNTAPACCFCLKKHEYDTDAFVKSMTTNLALCESCIRDAVAAISKDSKKKPEVAA